MARSGRDRAARAAGCGSAQAQQRQYAAAPPHSGREVTEPAAGPARLVLRLVLFLQFFFLTHDYAPCLMSYGADWEMGVCTGGVRNRRAVAWRTRRASAWPVCQLGVRMDENYMVAALLAMLSLMASVSAAPAKLLKSTTDSDVI